MISQRERKRIEGLADRARKFIIEEIPKRRKECEANGHKDFFWNEYVINSQSSYNDKVSGMCSYCLTFSERPLNEEECNSIRKFYQSMRESVTI